MFDSRDDKLLQGRCSGSHGKTQVSLSSKSASLLRTAQLALSSQRSANATAFDRLATSIAPRPTPIRNDKICRPCTLDYSLFICYIEYHRRSRFSPVAAFGFSGGIALRHELDSRLKGWVAIGSN